MRAAAETTSFVEYDLDNEDEDWPDGYNDGADVLPAEKFEEMLQLEISTAPVSPTRKSRRNTSSHARRVTGDQLPRKG